MALTWRAPPGRQSALPFGIRRHLHRRLTAGASARLSAPQYLQDGFSIFLEPQADKKKTLKAARREGKSRECQEK